MVIIISAAPRSHLGIALLLSISCLVNCANSSLPPTSSENGYRLSFTEQGNLATSTANTQTEILAAAKTATDVFVFSHGWWNTPEKAECRYSQVIGEIRKRKPDSLPADYRPLLVGIYWPSAIFPVEKGDCDSAPSSGEGTKESEGMLESGGAEVQIDIPAWAKAAFPTASGRPEFAAELNRVTVLLNDDRQGRRLTDKEAEELVGILLQWRHSGEPQDAQMGEGPEQDVFQGSAAEVMERWKGPKAAPGPEGTPESFVSKKWITWANVFTFWTMKDRAGVVGSHGICEFLSALQPERTSRGLRIHLIGHSFGAKVVSSALTCHGRGLPNHVDSVLILQGAISHFSFSTSEEIRKLGVQTEKSGRYVDIVSKGLVHGPLLVTMTGKDKQLLVGYNRGVAISGDFLEAGQTRKYGSLGYDGIQGPPVLPLKLPQERLKDKVRQRPLRFNVDATAIMNGHSDLIKDELFTLFWDMVQATQASSLPPSTP